jgi:hypothetical protein
VSETFQEARKLRIGSLKIGVMPKSVKERDTLYTGLIRINLPGVNVEQKSLVLIYYLPGSLSEQPKRHEAKISSAPPRQAEVPEVS